jgi:hypothetical protein
VKDSIDCVLGDGVVADPVDRSYGHSVRIEDIWNAASKMPRMIKLVRGFVE